MTNLDITNILYCRLDNLTKAAREQKRATTLRALGLLTPQDSLAILEEATQNSSSFLDMPIAFLSIFGDNQQQLIKSVVGLSHLGFNQELVINRQISPEDSFCIHVVDSLTPLAIEHTLQDPFFCQSILTQHCGIRSYLGVPLITRTGECIGTLAVMGLQPHRFKTKDLQFLTTLARLTMTQLENPRTKPQLQLPVNSLNINFDRSSTTSPNHHHPGEALLASVKLQLLAKLIEELRTPLTSVMGMTGILQQQIYGLLTPKQQEYLQVIRQSGQRMLVRIEEIIALDVDHASSQPLTLANVDMEMLCQQVVNSLQGVIQDKKQQVHLSIQEGNRIWLVDRRIVQPMIYYLVAVMLDTLPGQSQVSIRLDCQNHCHSIQVTSTTEHTNLPSLALPSLTEKKPDYLQFQSAQSLEPQPVSAHQSAKAATPGARTFPRAVAETQEVLNPDQEEKSQLLGAESWHSLGLLLSYQLVESHGGKMLMQDNAELGYGYVAILPQALNN